MSLKRAAFGAAKRVLGRFVTQDEAWFEASQTSSDLLRVFQSPQPVPGARNEEFPTIILDLRRPAEDLFNEIKKNTRYEIRRAERDGVCVALSEGDPATLASFAQAYERLSDSKGLDPLNLDRLHALARAGRLAITSSTLGGEALSWHAYVTSPRRVRLLHSVSERWTQSAADPALSGRANRFHHWKDVLLFQERGVAEYDFGGWYAGQTDAARLQINKFKEGFGGEIRTEYHALVAQTPIGKLALRLSPG